MVHSKAKDAGESISYPQIGLTVVTPNPTETTKKKGGQTAAGGADERDLSSNGSMKGRRKGKGKQPAAAATVVGAGEVVTANDCFGVFAVHRSR